MNLNPPLFKEGLSIFRPTWVEVSGSAFSSNLQSIRTFLGPRVKILAVLKANAYGHDASLLAPWAVKSGASFIGVSSIEEGLAIKKLNLEVPIIILGGIYPLKNFDVVLDNQFIPTVASLESAKVLNDAAQKRKQKAAFHLKVDTGMNRIGVSVEEAKKILTWCVGQPGLDLQGVYSHLSSADSDIEFTKKQLKEFQALKDFSKEHGYPSLIFHLSNSAGMWACPEAHLDMVRPGLSLYGYSLGPISGKVKLLPVLSWHTQIVFIKKVRPGTPISYGQTFKTKKESVIATLPVGYADGVPRRVSNTGFVLVSGQKCPIVGRVTMDQIMIDVTGVSAEVGTNVVLIGKQGQVEITVNDWASWAETISYEIFCGISHRVPRILKENL